MEALFEDKVLMITGGTGSFGKAVLKQFIDSPLKEIRIFSRDEKKQHDMRIAIGNPKVNFYLGDVRDFDSIYAAMHGVDFVFQAAALKQVPSCEFFPIEATRTNVFGTGNVIKAAISNKVQKIICLSTDKAAYPINTMGITKALMEKVAIAESRNLQEKTTKICITRYGNILASRGSVIPLFVDQIKRGDPITVTDPGMTRFLMTQKEAVSLVLFAFKNCKQGDLFVRKAPSSTILNLVNALKIVFKSKSEIKIIGTRLGEKKHETLCTREEMAKAIEHEDYFRIPSGSGDLNYNKFFTEGDTHTTAIKDYNSYSTRQLSVEEVVEKLLETDFIQQELASWKAGSKY